MADNAVVIVSGGAAESPFTTPTSACATGLAAGNTDTALRAHLLAADYAVFTSPAKVGGGVISASPGFGGFSDGPGPLPAEMTVDSVGDMDLAGEHLAAFLGFLYDEHAVRIVDLVGHSMGGLFSRAAIRILDETSSPLHVRSLTTLGTPWQGSFAADVRLGTTDVDLAGDDETMRTIIRAAVAEGDMYPGGASDEVSWSYLMDGGWNDRQAGVLDDIPVTLIAGDRLRRDGGDRRVWPNDGLVTVDSALAVEIGSDVLPRRNVEVFPDVHSIFFSDQLGLPWEAGLTWDPDVLAFVAETIRSSGQLP